MRVLTWRRAGRWWQLSESADGAVWWLRLGRAHLDEVTALLVGEGVDPESDLVS